MKDTPLVSVIVPIYGVEPYLHKCIDSILAQTYVNLEILLVDDGSPDKCGEICEEYKARDNRVIALHKENGGLSDARNYGLKRSRGSWIAFIDSDDFISPFFIESLYRAAHAYNYPIAAVSGGKHFKDGETCFLEHNKCPTAPTTPLDAHSAIEKMLYQRIATGAQWRLYRRETLGQDPFPVGFYYEDLASTYLFIARAKNIALLETNNLYAYRIRSSSIIHQEFAAIKAESALAIAAQLYRDITLCWPDLSKAVASRCFSLCRMVYAQVVTSHGSDEETDRYKRDLWDVIEKYRHVVMHDADARPQERLAAAISQLGEKPFCGFCRVCRRLGMMQ